MASTDLDHAIVLQVERGLEALTDRVDKHQDFLDEDTCDCECGFDEIEDLQKTVGILEKKIERLTAILSELLS